MEEWLGAVPLLERGMWAESAQDTGGQKEQEGTEDPLWVDRLEARHSHIHSQLL